MNMYRIHDKTETPNWPKTRVTSGAKVKIGKIVKYTSAADDTVIKISLFWKSKIVVSIVPGPAK